MDAESDTQRDLVTHVQWHWRDIKAFDGFYRVKFASGDVQDWPVSRARR